MAMQYRKLGKTGLEVGAIGLGTEHLERSRSTMEDVLRIAVGAGVNYIDLIHWHPELAAAFWDNFAPAVRTWRDKLILAAHWGPPDVNLEECQACFEGILDRVGNGYAEVAILAVVDTEEQWDGPVQKAAERLLQYKEQGRISHIGLSGHFVPTVTKAINSGLIDVLMFGINLVEYARAQGEIDVLYQACSDQDVGLVAMKPYYGGALFSAGGRRTGITPTQCLAFVLSQPVSTAVPGIRNVEELQATLHYLEATDEETDHSSVKDIHRYLAEQCVYCWHCHPCPQGIEMGGIIWLVDQAQSGITDELRLAYSKHEVKASRCTECGLCIERCPFGVDVIAKMQRAMELFEANLG